MRRAIIFFCLLAMPARATISCVGTAPTGITCGVSYAATAAQIQAALDAAVSGDTIYIQPGNYPTSATNGYLFHTNADPLNPINVMSSQYDWLPCANCRITPSYRPLLPILSTTQINVPSLQGNLDANGKPPQGWIFTGIGVGPGGISGRHPSQFGNGFFETGGGNLWQITSAALNPNFITLDRVLFSGVFDDSIMSTDVVIFNGTNLTIKNSYIQPQYCVRNECHSIVGTTIPGPLTITNNFVGTAAIPIFTGGSEPEYNPFDGSTTPTNITIRYNKIERPLKYWPDYYDAADGNFVCSAAYALTHPYCTKTATPHPEWFTANGRKSMCEKNLLEFKSASDVISEFNVHENVWGDGFCYGQFYGFTGVFRQIIYQSPAINDVTYYPGIWLANELRPTITVRDSAAHTTSGTYILPVNCPYTSISNCAIPGWTGVAGPVINITTPTPLANAPLGSTIHTTLSATGGTPPYTWSISNAPSWLTVNPTTGVLGGTVPQGFGLHLPTGSSTFTWDGWYNLVTPGQAIGGVQLGTDPAEVIDMHLILTANNTTHTGTVSGTFGIGGDPIAAWQFDTDPTPTLRRTTIRNSIFRTVASCFNVQMRDIGAYPNSGDFGRMNGLTISNNLCDNSTSAPLLGISPVLGIAPQAVQAFNDTVGGKSFTFDHVTAIDGNLVPAGGIHNITISADNMTVLSTTTGYRVTNNLFPDVNTNDGSNYYSLFPSSGYSNDDNWCSAFEPISTGTQIFSGNYMPRVTTKGCVTATASGNQSTPGSATLLSTSYKVPPGSALSKAATDGTDIGVNPGLLPMIKNIRVTASANTALLEADLSGPIRDAGNTQPCALEVSSSTTSGDVAFTVTVTDSTSNSTSGIFYLPVNCALCSATSYGGGYVGTQSSLSITTDTYQGAVVSGGAVNITFAAINGTPPYSWSLGGVSVGSAPPSWLSISSGGVLTGTVPTMPSISTLVSYLGDYTTTNDLNPAYFKQADESNRPNPLLLPVVVNGGHVAWPIGQVASVSGDDGLLHDLRLQPSTQYGGRLMCYGDTQTFTFTTPAATSGASAMPMQLATSSGVSTVEVDYGQTSATTSSVSNPAGSGGHTTVSIPVTAGVPLYYRVTYKNNAGNIVYRGALQILIP